MKPGPLSRILMMVSPEGPQLDALAEVEENAMDATLRSLAEELGVSEDDSPFRDKQPQPRPQVPAQSKPPADAQKAAASGTQTKNKDKGGKAKAAPPPHHNRFADADPGGPLEKENVKRAKLSAPLNLGSSSGSGSGSAGWTKSTGSRDGKKGSRWGSGRGRALALGLGGAVGRARSLR